MLPLRLADLEALARAKLPVATFDYYAGGAHDEHALRESLAAYARVHLHHRVLVDVSARDLSTTVLGEPVRIPVLVAPTAFHKLAHPDGEIATARAAEAAGTVFVLSTLSNTPLEEVTAATRAPVWFQLYVYRDREATKAVVARAEAAGCRALVLTVDAPLIGMRERDARNRFALPPDLVVANMLPAGYGAITARGEGSGLAAYLGEMLDTSLSWKDIAWLRSITNLPIVIKGIARADDARRAVDAGAAAIVVSNHGGRQLDSSPPTIEVLPRVVDAVADRCEVLVDGGVRRGTDVLKAIALGARAVLIGRPVLWGLAIEGQAGVKHVFDLLSREIDLAMALAGCASIDDVTRDLIDGGE